MDSDGVGDKCDPDADGDGCSNRIDQHMYEAWEAVGWTQYIGCGIETVTDTAFEGDNYDAAQERAGAGVPNCRDLDDDNDGICDEYGPYDENPAKGVPAGGCVPGPITPPFDYPRDPCPQSPDPLPCVDYQPGPPCPMEWLGCLGTGCAENFLKLYEVTNPFDAVIVEEFQVFDGTIFALPPMGMAPSELAAMTQAPEAGPGARTLASTRRIELWSRDPEELIEVIAEYDPETDVDMGEFRYGPIVAITPYPDGDGLEVETRYAMALRSGAPPADADSDGRPDWLDNCRLVANHRQADADSDGMGNLCDADLDNDDMVTTADVEAVEDCLGANLSITLEISEPDDPDPEWESDGYEQPQPSDAALALADACPAADLNDDLYVDDADLVMAMAAEGTHPGPSSFVNRRPVANAGMDQAGECGSPVSLDGCGSYDPDGDGLDYSWDAPTCVVLDTTACATEVICNAGDNLVTLTVNDGTVDSTAATVGVAVTGCVSSGEIPPTMTVTRIAGDDMLMLEWEDSCSATDEYGIYQGVLGNWYDHVAVQCGDGDGVDLSEMIPEPAASSYFLIVPYDQTEAPPGKDSSDVPRPQGAVGQRCVTVQAPAGC
jgi:hypothetical protein